jgi:Do/DeqQ family serine protease
VRGSTLRIAVPVILLALAAPVLHRAALPRADDRPSSNRRTPVVQAVERVRGAVVNVSAEELVRVRVGGQPQSMAELLFGDMLETPRYRKGYAVTSLGSGVIVSPEGYVLTNNHVVERGTRLRVGLLDGREFTARVVGADPSSDLAVLKLQTTERLPFVPAGRSEDLLIGETVIAIGNPFGLSNSVTTGILSAVHRTVRGPSGRNYSDFIQTDAAINPGNSGGALVNILGELIGINTAIVGGANTIGFAIPVDRVRRIVDDLLHFGEVKPVWLGLRGVNVTSDSGRASARGQGLRVRAVYPGSPAEKAGLRPGDLVVSLDGKPVESREDFDTTLTSLGPGRTLTLGFRRKGEERTAKATTARAPGDLGLEVLRREIGLAVSETRSGVAIASVRRGTPADEQGLARGDRVLAINNQKVDSLDDLNHAVELGFSRSALVLVVARGPYAYTLTFGLE